MSLLKEITRIKDLMLIKEEKNKTNLFDDFDLSKFKNIPPPKNDSEKTKKELEYLKSINLKKRFVQEKDNIVDNFNEFLKSKEIDDKKFIKKLKKDARKVIQELKSYYKRPRPFVLDPKLKDVMLDSMVGYAYPSGHSTQAHLLYYYLIEKYPKYKKDFKQITDDIVFSRQMARAHYPSDIEFGKKLAKSMYDHVKTKGVINKN
jgi:hypothetical protein